jgi:hypothetical protein
MKTEEDLRRLCNQIQESDSSVRFVGIPNKMGRQIVSSHRHDLAPITHTTGNRNVCYRISFENEY